MMPKCAEYRHRVDPRDNNRLSPNWTPVPKPVLPGKAPITNQQSPHFAPLFVHYRMVHIPSGAAFGVFGAAIVFGCESLESWMWLAAPGSRQSAPFQSGERTAMKSRFSSRHTQPVSVPPSRPPTPPQHAQTAGNRESSGAWAPAVGSKMHASATRAKFNNGRRGGGSAPAI